MRRSRCRRDASEYWGGFSRSVEGEKDRRVTRKKRRGSESGRCHRLSRKDGNARLNAVETRRAGRGSVTRTKLPVGGFLSFLMKERKGSAEGEDRRRCGKQAGDRGVTADGRRGEKKLAEEKRFFRHGRHRRNPNADGGEKGSGEGEFHRTKVLIWSW